MATFARAGEEVAGSEHLLDARKPAANDDLFQPVDLGGESLSATIGALGGASNDRSGDKPKALLTFWPETRTAGLGGSVGDAADTLSAEAAVAAAAALAAGKGPGNVLIPLPMAAWSALSAMGSYGVLAGLRRLRRRTHG